MTLLVTGGSGFVMSVLTREWLERDPTARAVILDRAPLDTAATQYFAPVRDRLDVVVADIRDHASWGPRLDALGITAIVHGATVTPISRGSATEAKRQPEAEDPAGIVEINLMGTVRMLDWARSKPSIKRFVYVSSGAVYRNHGPDWSSEPLPEDGYVAPLKLYGISKFASEMVVNRFADLYGMSAISIRLPSVYGPMDRITESRNFRHIPNRIAHMALARETIRPTNLQAVGDYLHSVDAARGILALIDQSKLNYRCYNIATAEAVTIGDFISWAAEKVPGTRHEIATFDSCNIDQDLNHATGMWGAYDIARIQRDTGWKPRPVREAFHDYIDWIAAQQIASSKALGGEA